MGNRFRIGLVIGLFATLGCSPTEEAARNLILISVDTLRADHLGAHGSQRGLTPHLDALANESIVFDRAYAPSAFTLASVSSLLTGRYPEEVGVSWNQSVLDPEIPTLAMMLRAAGYRTGAVVSNFVLREHRSGIETGFGHFDDVFPAKEAVRGFPEREAEDTTRAARVALAAVMDPELPFFLWVHYQDPHGPYTPGEALRTRFFDTDRAKGDVELPVSPNRRGAAAIPSYQFLEERRDPEFYRAGYEGEIHRADRAIGALLDAIRKAGLFENSVIVFTADHGESLGENDYWFAHGEFLSDALVRVPLWVRVPGAPPARRHDTASLVDIVPTALGALGIAPTATASGRDLLADDASDAERPVYLTALAEASEPRFGLIAHGHKYLVTPRLPGDGNGLRPNHERLIRVGEEAEDLSKKDPKLAEQMRQDLYRFRTDLEIPDRPARDQEISPEERSQLEALGYLGGTE